MVYFTDAYMLLGLDELINGVIPGIGWSSFKGVADNSVMAVHKVDHILKTVEITADNKVIMYRCVLQNSPFWVIAVG